MAIRLGTLLVALLMLGGCTTSTPTTARPSPISCTEVSDLVPNTEPGFGGGYGMARAGPIWFSAFGQVRAGKAVLDDYSPGEPTKVLIHPNPGPHPEVQIRGTECASGRALHFCYQQGSCGFTGQPVSESDLEARGDAVVKIAKDQPGDYTGYMLFPRRGNYLIRVQQADLLLGSVIFRVR
ncbi:MAG: hypothetical protein ACR2MY_08465 [Candidatus Dormibacteria bacterium]